MYRAFGKEAEDAVTLEDVMEIVSYEPDTGLFRRKVSKNQHPVGGVCGKTVGKGNHLAIRVNGRNFMAHRVAWLFTYGEWPDGAIDHIDGDPQNNRVSNLRIATASQNGGNLKIQTNNTSGFPCVYRKKGTDIWCVSVRKNNKNIGGGWHRDKNKAIHAAIELHEKLFGEFSNLRRHYEAMTDSKGAGNDQDHNS